MRLSSVELKRLSGNITPISGSPPERYKNTPSDNWESSDLKSRPTLERSASEELLSAVVREHIQNHEAANQKLASVNTNLPPDSSTRSLRNTMHSRSTSPPPVSTSEAVNRAIALSKKLSISNIPSQITDSGDLMLDMTGYKSSEEDALRAELIARKILADELQGNYDIGALIGADEHGNLWIYSSEEAKEAARRKADMVVGGDAASDPGYHSNEEGVDSKAEVTSGFPQISSERPAVGLVTPPQTPPGTTSAGEPNRNYAKTLRLTSDQLKALDLKHGPNSMSFSVNRATCHAYMYYWSHKVPVVISDIDGTITKYASSYFFIRLSSNVRSRSDAWGHVLTMIGRDWTHLGVAKLYTDIVANGYNIMYLTSRSVGQADTTRAYLDGVVQDGIRLPKGPVILSPDRTIAALRREIYLRKPEVFKMACLRDILSLFGNEKNVFYAGFGNRLTDALSYRSVNIPSNRIFTINSNAEVSIDILTLNKYRSSYVSMREIVDHFFPPVGLLVKSGGEEFTDFNYWRSPPLDLDDFSGSESEEDTTQQRGGDRKSIQSEDERSDGARDEHLDAMTDSYPSRDSVDEAGELVDSMLGSIEDEELSDVQSGEEEEDKTPMEDDNNDGDSTDDERGRLTARS